MNVHSEENYQSTLWYILFQTRVKMVYQWFKHYIEHIKTLKEEKEVILHMSKKMRKNPLQRFYTKRKLHLYELKPRSQGIKTLSQSNAGPSAKKVSRCQKSLKKVQRRPIKQHHHHVVPIGLTIEAIHDPIRPFIYVANTIATNVTTFGTTNE